MKYNEIIEGRHNSQETRDDISSDAFRAWFRGSKVVDGRNKPLLCYHGTFNEFYPSAIHPLSHFGTLEAASYRVRHDTTAKILKYYLCIKNPLVMDDSGDEEHTPDNLLRAINYTTGLWSDEEEDEILTFHNDIVTENIIQKLKENSYDGVMYTNMREDVGSRSWIIIDPKQAWNV